MVAVKKSHWGCRQGWLELAQWVALPPHSLGNERGNPMTISAEALRELHRIHRQITDLRERLDRGPKQVRAAQGNVKRAELELDEAKATLRKTRMASDEKQLQLKQREARLQDLKVKLNQAASNREYQAFKEQIAADQQANSVLSDEIIEALDHLEHLQADITTLEQNLKKAQEETKKVATRVNEQQAGLESELARVTADLREAENKLPSDFRAEYDRVAKARGEDALAPVEGETCGGCYQMLTPNMMSELLMSKPVFCKSCGCLLYLPEDRGGE
ncbi:MAG: hypothetical protein KDA62_16320 [Planctomycetales bacterium]|nr:hypothetical protein [Planctomycetales bacterium]